MGRESVLHRLLLTATLLAWGCGTPLKQNSLSARNPDLQADAAADESAADAAKLKSASADSGKTAARDSEQPTDDTTKNGVKQPDDSRGARTVRHDVETLRFIERELADASADELDEQQQFFSRHIGPWMQTLFTDLVNAPSARFYRAVGILGGALVQIEGRYLGVGAAS